MVWADRNDILYNSINNKPIISNNNIYNNNNNNNNKCLRSCTNQ